MGGGNPLGGGLRPTGVGLSPHLNDSMLTMRLSLLLPAAGLLLAASPAQARSGDTLKVPASFPTIQDAIDAASSGDVIVVSDGFYTGSRNKDLNFFGKDLVVRSENGAATTVIDCEADAANPARGFVFENGETRASVIEGFTICNAATLDGAVSDPFNGGAVQILNSSPTIRDCTFIHNYAGCWGAAVYAGHGGTPLIENCMFLDNYAADDGGGVFLWNGSDVTIVNSVFVGNEARVTGGAISGFGGGMLIADRITVVENVAPHGSAVFSADLTKITNSILWDNTGSPEPIWQNGSVTVQWTLVQGGYAGVGNLDADPLLRTDGYHLRRHSPAINAGDPGFVLDAGMLDIDGEQRVVRQRLDMGADEFPWTYKTAPRLGRQQP